jgi:hypothetical protein
VSFRNVADLEDFIGAYEERTAAVSHIFGQIHLKESKEGQSAGQAWSLSANIDKVSGVKHLQLALVVRSGSLGHHPRQDVPSHLPVISVASLDNPSRLLSSPVYSKYLNWTNGMRHTHTSNKT